MARLCLGAASSHAFALLEPDKWDENRLRNRRSYELRYGKLPTEQSEVAIEEVGSRYDNIRSGFAAVRTALEEERPDVIVLVADDQNENFTENVLPQFAIYVGEHFLAGRLDVDPTLTRAYPLLATAILEECIQNDIDMSPIEKFPNDRLLAHAVGPILNRVDPQSRIPVVPIFVNAIHHPAPSGRRCYYLGQIIRKAIERFSEASKVSIYGSGGLSHFTAGYPWKAYRGPHTHGAIDEAFDRWIVEGLAAGNGSKLSMLDSDELLAHGEIELRSWIVALGAIGDVKPKHLAYEPFYRAIMGMCVALWMPL